MSDTARAPIHVHVRLFASYREAAGANRLEASLPDGSSVSELLEQLAPRVPALTLGQARGLVAVNFAYVPPETVLHDGDEVALIPPVSGGGEAD